MSYVHSIYNSDLTIYAGRIPAAGLIEAQAAGTIRLESRGSGAVERVMSLVLLGDLVSIYLAVLRGIDPTPVDVIERLKEELAERETV